MAILKKCLEFTFIRCNLNLFARKYHSKGHIQPKYTPDSSSTTFQANDLSVILTKHPQPLPDKDSLQFGHVFSDHMLSVEWTADGYWTAPVVSPLQNISLHPAAKTLQYCTQVFEGLKAYRGYDDRVRLFRPMYNMNRMLTSAERAGLPSFDPEELLKCIMALISVDKKWVPSSSPDRPYSMYIRPTMIGTESTLGISSSRSAMLYVITGPAGSYFKSGLKPVSLFADPNYTRSWPGGPGMYKMGSNYAPTISVLNTSVSHGCDQTLWLYGEDHQVTEAGTMNLFTLLINDKGEKELVTAPLDGLILPGVTRDSLLHLAMEWEECKVTERVLTMSELTKAIDQKRVLEMFGAGTACVVSPVNKIKYCNKWYHIDNAPTFAQRLYSRLTDIQYGKISSDWMIEVD